MGKLIEFAFDDKKPPDTQLRAIRDALDRAGLQPKTTVDIGIVKPYETVFEGIYSGPPIHASSVSTDYNQAGLGQGVADAETAFAPTQPHSEDQTQSTDQARPREYGDYTDYVRTDVYSSNSSEGSESLGDDPPRRPRPREGDRERQPQPHERHITGGDAIRAASAMKAIESPHKGYRRP